MDTIGRKDGRGILIDVIEQSLAIMRFRQNKPHGPFLIIDQEGNKKIGEYNKGKLDGQVIQIMATLPRQI